MIRHLSRALGMGLGLILACGPVLVHAEVDDATRVALEALSRLKDADLEANPALKQAVLKVVERVRGEPEFVTLVRDFRLPGEEAELIRFAAGRPESPEAAEALRLALSPTGTPLVQEQLQGRSGPALIRALGATGDPRSLPLLEGVLTNATRAPESRQAAVKALATTADGAGMLLTQARAGTLDPALQALAVTTLKASNWPGVRTAVAAAFPESTPDGAGAWPPLAELLRLPGDPTRGAAIYRRPEVGCITCHQVGADGVDFGPKLTEIGAKLGKDALMTSILEPSAGISFGYEGWRLMLKDGSDLLGLVVSETPDELVLKQPGGLLARVKVPEIESREKQPLSLMPAGLHQALSPQEFVDLIAYLASLRPSPAPGA